MWNCAMRSTKCVDDRFPSPLSHLSQLGARLVLNGMSLVGGRPHLHSAARNVPLASRGFGCLLAQSFWMGTGRHSAGQPGGSSAQEGAWPSAALNLASCIIPTAVCNMLPTSTWRCWRRGFLISMSRTGNPYDNAQGGKLHENAQVRSGLSEAISRSRRRPKFDHKLPAAGIQWQALAFRFALGSRRSLKPNCKTRRPLRGNHSYEFFQASGNLSRCSSIIGSGSYMATPRTHRN